MLPPYRIFFSLVAACLAGSVDAAVSVYLPPEKLAESATLVLEATVERTASGYDGVRRSLATYVTLDVETVHRGPRYLERVVLREPGGRFGDLVHDVDAVPLYREGERVLVFLEPARDGALRTSGMFFGKYSLEPDAEPGLEAVRDLGGQGRILGRPLASDERAGLDDLVALTVHADRPRGRRQSPPERDSRPWRATPPEFARLAWDEGAGEASSVAPYGAGAGALDHLSMATDTPNARPNFKPVSMSDPARWSQVDAGTPLAVNVDPTGNPLGDDLAATAEVGRALAAWTAVPESRVALTPADTDYDYLGSHASSPASVYSGVNIVLFDDPYADLPEPVDCAGVLAIGGYWRSSAWTSQVNGRDFHPALQLYVILNDGFECVLSDPDNLAEVLTHELGHGLGFGHSTAPDSIMRSFAYGQRGPRLGLDDRDAAHCHYPHELELLQPAEGEPWSVGSTRTLSWVSTAEAGGDPGVVSLEYSTDPAEGWIPIATDTPNDGSHSWTLPADLAASTSARVRVVRHPLAGQLPAGYPASCSGSGERSFAIDPTCDPRGLGSGCSGPRRAPSPVRPQRRTR